MSKRMTKMEACHHLTVIRDELARDCDRMRERIKESSDDNPMNNSDSRRYCQEKLTETEMRIRAIEMGGSALTR